MEVKRPFSQADWLATPKPVRDYIETLERNVLELSAQLEHLQAQHTELKTRLDQLEARLNQNSKNSNKPPSSDPPFDKPPREADRKKKKKGSEAAKRDTRGINKT